MRNSLGLCAVYAVLLVFFAGCAAPRHSKILVHMIKAQEEYFGKEILPGFDKENAAVTEVAHYENTAEIKNELDKYPGGVALVKIPYDKSQSLIAGGLVRPLDSFLSPEELKEFKQTFLLTSLGASGGKQYLIPRKFETRIMVYCKSKVADACAVWHIYRDSISAELRKINGFGLPATYILKSDPNAWDFYDVYVVGWIWAHTAYDGTLKGRIAHRGKRYSGTSQRIIDRIFECRGDASQVLSMRGAPVADAFAWEAIYAASVYNKRMWEEAWSGADIWKGFLDGEVFLAFMTQLDCFFIHGTGQDGLDGYLKDPSDMGVAVMPKGCSATLDKNGTIERDGCKAVTTGGWWWGIPQSFPDPRMAYQMARYITGTKSQLKDCSRFGMIPVRKDILSDMSMLFGEGWITEIYETSFKQLMQNGDITLPSSENMDKIENLYVDAWYDIVVGKNWSNDGSPPRWDYIQKVLETKYAPRAAAILGN